MTLRDMNQFREAIAQLEEALKGVSRVLITAPAVADGDSVGSQLALRRMITRSFPHVEVWIVNDEPLPDRYLFLPGIEHVHTPETFAEAGGRPEFQMGIQVDGGVDRAGRIKEWFDRCPHRVFIDHHIVSCEYNYTIRIVDPQASATTEIIYYLSQLPLFRTPVDAAFAQYIYLGLIFDTGFFRHSNTSPEVMELAARLLRTGFNFTEVGERGMLSRTYVSLKLLSDTLARAERACHGRLIWSTLPQDKMREFNATPDDREGIIDQLFLTQGVQVAALFFDLGGGETKVSFRSQGGVDVAKFARSLTKRGGGHSKAAGANFDLPLEEATGLVLERLQGEVAKLEAGE